MHHVRSFAGPARSHGSALRPAFSLLELIVAIATIVILVAMLLPAVQAVRESSRRTSCAHKLRQLAGALLDHEAALRAFPPGATVSDVDACTGCYDPWGEARRTVTASDKKSGSGWILPLLPRIEEGGIADAWDRSLNVKANAQHASRNIDLLYCPSRRDGIRVGRGDAANLPDSTWRGGGTDYGACLGRGDGFVNSTADTISGRHRFQAKSADESIKQGLFRANVPVAAGTVTDGLSNTIALGEMQRLRPRSGATGDAADVTTSQDGWAVGGVATLFTTSTDPDNGNPGGLNNGFFESPGSDHRDGANFAFADGSVRFLSEYIDARDNASVFPLLGSISDGTVSSIAASGF